jgi:heptosyltransferase-3
MSRMTRDYEKILVLARPSIGDVLLSTPLIHALRARWPSATLDVLIYAGQREILEGNPDVDEVIEAGKHPSFGEYAAQMRRMGRHYDLGVSVSTSDRALWYLLACARERYSVVPGEGARGPWRSAWKSWTCRATLEADTSGRHTLEQNHLLGELLALEPGYEVVTPRCADSEAVLSRTLPEIWGRRPYAVLHLTPGHPFKRWHLAGWSALARWLQDRGLEIVLTGSDSGIEREYLHAAVTALPSGVHSVAGKLRLGHVSALIERAALYVGPDTVTTHMAAAIGTPTVAIYGPTNPLIWAPWPRGHVGPEPPFARKGTQRTRNVLLVQGPGHCVPCQQLGCERHPASRSDCLDELPATSVIAAAEQMLDRPACVA